MTTEDKPGHAEEDPDTRTSTTNMATSVAAPSPRQQHPLPTYYLSHGSPMLPLEDHPARAFFQSLPTLFPRTAPAPTAILVVSAHWDTHNPTVTSAAAPGTIHDFYGFPRALYELTYPAPGHPPLARRVVALLQAAGFPGARADPARGLDHGAWAPLLLAFPDARIPVVQVSVQSRRGAAWHFRLGRALAPVRDEGVLVVGSGSAVHNLGMLGRGGDGGVRDGPGKEEAWAVAFDKYVRDAVESGRVEDVVEYEARAPFARLAHPSSEHFVPLLVAWGAAGEGAKGELVHSSWSYGALSYSSYAFHSKAE